MPAELQLWFYTVTDEITKRRRQTRYRMTEQDALERFGADAVKVECSLEVRARNLSHTSDFLRALTHPQIATEGLVREPRNRPDCRVHGLDNPRASSSEAQFANNFAQDLVVGAKLSVRLDPDHHGSQRAQRIVCNR